MNGHGNRKNTQCRKRDREEVTNKRDSYIQINMKKLIITDYVQDKSGMKFKSSGGSFSGISPSPVREKRRK